MRAPVGSTITWPNRPLLEWPWLASEPMLAPSVATRNTPSFSP